MTAHRLARATPDNWMFPPDGGWTYDQVKDLELPYDWELVDGAIVVRGMTHFWHDQVRDGLLVALRQARPQAFGVNVERCVLVDEHAVLKPDLVVYERTGLDLLSLECLPASAVRLAVEVVSPGSRGDDRFRKPGLLAERGVPHYWRIERSVGDAPVVHEFWRHHEMRTFAPSPNRPVHEGKLTTDVPFPVDIDLLTLLES
ncbi:Uma2 family endonuclease [Streptomyces sp. RKND-216]|nr:Uma2 family endonuclease [Streptomyces sp. RKND-216]